MGNKELHLSDQEMLRAVDGELRPRRAEEVRKHLSSCWDCRARVGEIEVTIADFVRLRRADLDPQLPESVGSRALLKAQLAELTITSRPCLWSHFRQFSLGGRGMAYASVLLLLATLGTWFGYLHNARNDNETPIAELNSNPVPKPSLTPGSVRPVALDDICSAQNNEETRAIPAPLQHKVFQEYGLANARATDYEVDYLITPELGGADDIRNLWPEPHSSTLWNSYVKDDLENQLHQMVCAGQLELPTAQHDIATNWIAAYKKYFHTERPIQDHANGNSDSIQKPKS